MFRISLLLCVAAVAAFVVPQGPVLLANGGIANSPQCDTEWVYFSMTNSCYWAGDHLDFDAAEANCKNLGGHLASIHNQFENNFIMSIVESGEKQNSEGLTWIGLKYTTNAWRWTDGSDTGYQYWMKGEPAKENKYACTALIQDDYTYQRNSKSQWSPETCSIQMRKYVCKKTANF